MAESVEKIKQSAHKLGNSIEAAKPYYEARLYAAQVNYSYVRNEVLILSFATVKFFNNQLFFSLIRSSIILIKCFSSQLKLSKEAQQAQQNHDKAKSVHAAAKEMVYLAEQGLGEKSTLDTACQEMLSHAASKWLLEHII